MFTIDPLTGELLNNGASLNVGTTNGQPLEFVFSPTGPIATVTNGRVFISNTAEETTYQVTVDASDGCDGRTESRSLSFTTPAIVIETCVPITSVSPASMVLPASGIASFSVIGGEETDAPTYDQANWQATYSVGTWSFQYVGGSVDQTQNYSFVFENDCSGPITVSVTVEADVCVKAEGVSMTPLDVCVDCEIIEP